MSLKSILAFGAAIGALAVFTAACSAAPDTQSSESSSEALIGPRCVPPPIRVCAPGEEAPWCHGPCPMGQEWSPTPPCGCVPIPDAAVPPIDAGCFDTVMCTANRVWSPTTCKCECKTVDAPTLCGPFQTWSETACACVPNHCPSGILCPLGGATESNDPLIRTCCPPFPVAE